ncbi:hypothetical protein ACIQGZ_17305 [Streptomyces sp. NPDC092296]|uniref:hypothetical protein n=1 Tax=Streptomyces sp. NPDC092296 TaxID=3366012 RepID=UPI0037FA842E
MATFVTLHVRHDAYKTSPRGDSGAMRRDLVLAGPDEVDLDTLTPRARALAEALADARTTPYLASPMSIVLESTRTVREIQPRWEAYFTEEEASQPARETRTVNSLSAASEIGVTQWLEQVAHGLPLDRYPISAVGAGRVPSWRAGAADRYLTPETVLRYLRARGCPVDPTLWDRLRGTGHFPAPDRYVCGLPQWLPASLDAYATRPRDLWTVSRIAEYLGYGGEPKSAASSARRWMHRCGLIAEGRSPGRGGESLFPADQVVAAHIHRPKRGRPPRGGTDAY